MSVSAVILAAGRGQRMGAAENKILLVLGGVPVLWRSVAAFAASDRVTEIVIVARPGEETRVAAAIPDGATRVRVVAGGERRVDSARAGVTAAEGDYILIHDGARPLVSAELIARVIAGAEEHGACVPVLAVVDTLRRRSSEGRLLSETLDRNQLVAIQTPQGFRSELIRRALFARTAGDPWPDDAAAVLALGEPVACVDGDPRNIKLTTFADLRFAESLLRSAT